MLVTLHTYVHSVAENVGIEPTVVATIVLLLATELYGTSP